MKQINLNQARRIREAHKIVDKIENELRFIVNSIKAKSKKTAA